MLVYRAVNTVNGKTYIGMTSGRLSRRISSHKNDVKTGSTTYLHNAIRKYGIDAFVWSVVAICRNKEAMQIIERNLIEYYRHLGCYNIADGGTGGFVVPDDKIEDWKSKLSAARKGRKPALGMKHTEENKRFFSECSMWRDPKYPDIDAVNMSYKDAKAKYGISKTHFYRLRKKQIIHINT